MRKISLPHSKHSLSAVEAGDDKRHESTGQHQNNQARNRILIHVVESIIIQRQIDLLYSTDNGQYAYNNTELYILENEADALRAQNKESCLGNLRRGVYGAVVKPPDMQP